MSTKCGISEAATKMNAGIESAKGEVDGLIGDAVGGIADSSVNIKDKITELTSGIDTDLEGMAPELPVPEFKLQDQMTSLLEKSGNPTEMIQQMDEMKEKFGGNINLDKVFDDIGLDSKELNAMNEDYKGKLAEGTKLKEAQDKLNLKDKLAGGLGKVGEIMNSAKDNELLALAAGDMTAVGNLIGGAADKLFKKAPTEMLDGVCNEVPNLEMDAEGKVVEKGIPAKAAIEDAKPDEDKTLPKTDIIPQVKDQGLEVAEKIITEEETDTEPFDFGPAVDPEKLEDTTTDFEKDQQKLKEHQLKLRESQAAYTKKRREARDYRSVDRDLEFYHTAYSKFINYFKINMEIEYNHRDPLAERKQSSDEFTIRDGTFKAASVPVREVYRMWNMTYKLFFVYAPKGSENRHIPLRDELLKFKWVKVAGLEDEA